MTLLVKSSKMKWIKFVGVLFIALLIISCAKDEISPTIELIQPTGDVTVKRTESFDFEVRVTDDKQLKLIRLLLGTNLQEFIMFDTKTSHHIKSQIRIPENAELGEIDIVIEAIDEGKNKAMRSFKVFVIE